MKPRYLWLSIALGLLLCAGLLATLDARNNVALARAATNLVSAHSDAITLGANQVISTAYVVVRFGPYDTIVRPITFTQPISAYHALEMSGLDFTVQDSGFGPFLCSIEEIGDSSPTCDNGTQYWATYAWNSISNSWSSRIVGITSAMIAEDGHVEAFSWSDPGWAAVEPPPAPPLTGAWDALTWLETQQRADGSFGSGGDTAEVLMALGANRMDAADWRSDSGLSARGAMLVQGHNLATTTAGSGKLATALAAQGGCWPYTAMPPMAYYDDTTGAFAEGTGAHAWAMLGTAALSETIPPTATAYLLDLQRPNGGWEWSAGWGTDTNSTALALQALIAAGESPTTTAVISGVTYLETAQNTDGGFPYDPASPYGTDSDVNSTAYVVQALLAAGETPITGTWAINGTDPIAYLLGMQLPDGSFEWQPGSGANQLATQQAASALLFRPFPVRSMTLAPCNTTFLPSISHE